MLQVIMEKIELKERLTFDWRLTHEAQFHSNLWKKNRSQVAFTSDVLGSDVEASLSDLLPDLSSRL